MKNKNSLSILIPISIGELIDKITILEIKRLHMKDTKLDNVEKEIKILKDILKEKKLAIDLDLVKKLKEINNKLWVIEDEIRMKELKQIFDNEFIQLARLVYFENDKRASLKKEINQKYNSDLVEEKSYNTILNYPDQLHINTPEIKNV
tara:strand:+ start:390 stop:836 length:447 start_codon:yes stop_codon:yes gene_type:complete